MLGGKCVKCESVENLQFNHIDPNTKSFAIGKLLNFPKQVVSDELKKCQLLCKSCHNDKTIINKDGFDKKARGEKVSSSKLTEEMVRDIRIRLATESTVQIARDLGLNRNTIYFIKIGKTWNHVE